jgi:hypothetical protein
MAVAADRVKDRRFGGRKHLDAKRHSAGPPYPEEPLRPGVEEFDNVDSRVRFERLLDLLTRGASDPEQWYQRLASTGNRHQRNRNTVRGLSETDPRL